MKPFDVVGNVETKKKKTEGYHGMYEYRDEQESPKYVYSRKYFVFLGSAALWDAGIN